MYCPRTYGPFSSSHSSHSSLNSFISHGLMAPYCSPPGKLMILRLSNVSGPIPLSYSSNFYHTENASGQRGMSRMTQKQTHMLSLSLCYLIFGYCRNEFKLHLLIGLLDTFNHGKLSRIGIQIGIVGQDGIIGESIGDNSVDSHLAQILGW
mmetsp:Transcript_24407/g.56853  ORF Transcript_24407/g.56853 Transcript_24407/m.56853 type:complete len:151 (-) Transcript_24407:461-913(-)